MQQVAALAEASEVGQPVVGGIVVQMRRRQHDAALEAGMTEDQFTNTIKSYAWLEDKAGQAGKLASGAAQTGRRLWNYLRNLHKEGR